MTDPVSQKLARATRLYKQAARIPRIPAHIAGPDLPPPARHGLRGAGLGAAAARLPAGRVGSRIASRAAAVPRGIHEFRGRSGGAALPVDLGQPQPSAGDRLSASDPTRGRDPVGAHAEGRVPQGTIRRPPRTGRPPLPLPSIPRGTGDRVIRYSPGGFFANSIEGYRDAVVALRGLLRNRRSTRD